MTQKDNDILNGVYKDAIGMTKEDAQKYFTSKGLTMRVAMENGVQPMMTMDKYVIQLDRINVAVIDGAISDVLKIG